MTDPKNTAKIAIAKAISAHDASNASGFTEWDYRIVGKDTFDEKYHRATVTGSFADYESAVKWVKNSIVARSTEKVVAEVTA